MTESDPWAERAEQERQEWLWSQSLDAAWDEAEAAAPPTERMYRARSDLRMSYQLQWSRPTM